MNAMTLAHQGGWDETLLVLAPVALVGVLLKLANRRARRLLAEQQDELAASNGESGPRTDS
jgi:hypothetical protein